MEERIAKVVKYLVQNKYPQILDVNVSSEIDRDLAYSDPNRNLVYNVVLTFRYSDFESIDNAAVEMDNIKKLIREVVRMLGVTNSVRIFYDVVD
jgi:hypothetical protein